MTFTRAQRSALALPIVAVFMSQAGCGSSALPTAPGPQLTVSGAVSGLTVDGLILGLNGVQMVGVPAGNTTFQFSAILGSAYTVYVHTRPPGLLCTVTNGSGTASGSSVNGVAVACAPRAFDGFAVAQELTKRTDDFYDSQVNWPTNQASFGFCETASTTSALSYANYGTTTRISPRDTLLLASENSGSFQWKNPPTYSLDLNSLQFYLWYDPNLGELESFYGTIGAVAYSAGTVPDRSRADFTTLWDAFEVLPIQVADTTTNNVKWVASTAEWGRSKDDFQAGIAGGALEVEKVSGAPFPALSAFAGTLRSDQIISALQSGHLVLLMVYYTYWHEPQNLAGCQAVLPGYLYFDKATGLLAPPPQSVPRCLNDLWTVPNGPGYKISDEHWVYVFSYAQSSPAAAGAPVETVFFIRNSWGDKTKENGNYYATAGFLDGRTKAGGAEIIQSAYAIPIRTPPP